MPKRHKINSIIMADPKIIAPKEPVLVDSRIEIKVINLEQFQRVTLRVQLASRKPEYFESYGHYIADFKGELNISKHASFGGTYKGIDNMGLFWSMTPVPGQRKGSRFTAWDVEKPMEFEMFLFDGHVMSQRNAKTIREATEQLPQPLATFTILRTYLSENVERREINVGKLKGTLFVPKGNGQFPGVVDMFGGHGGLLEYRAAILASHGFVAFALAFYAYKDLPDNIEGLDLEYFIEAVHWLANHDKVLKNGVGFIGVSYGGQIALQVAAECPLVKAVVAISPPHIIRTPVKHKGEFIGKALLELSNSSSISMTEDRVVDTQDMLDYDSDELKRLEIHVEKIQGRIMIVSGEDDKSINTKKIIKSLEGRLLKYGRPPPIKLLYPGTGHLIEIPYMPMCSLSYLTQWNVIFAWGGSVMEHSAAQKHSWEAIRSFFLAYLQESSSKL